MATPDTADWSSRLSVASLPAPVLERAKLELDRLANETADRRELDRYLETLLAIPWARLSSDPPPLKPASTRSTPSGSTSARATSTKPSAKAPKPLDLDGARAFLDAQHVGLERAKERVLEEVAIRSLKPDAPQPLFYLVGPPYTGKAHFAKSIAALFGRPFVRRSLSGLARESDLRGRDRGTAHPHPGLFIDALIEAGVRDPVIYLEGADELAATDGNPVDALLAAVDDKRSRSFLDRYLGLPVDLSRALIILAGQGESGLARFWPGA